MARFVFEFRWTGSFWTPLLGMLAGALLAWAAGWWGLRDVLRRQPLTRVPLAPPEIAGAINLRGHIVTAIDMRSRLGTAPRGRDETTMCVVVEGADEWFCLIVDAVGDVITIADSAIEPTPASVPDEWATMMRGVHRMPNCLLLLLDIEQLLSL